MSFLAHRRSGLLVFLCVLGLLAPAQEEKRLTIYTAEGAHTTPIADQNGVEYVPLLEVLKQVGSVSGKADGKKYIARLGDTNAEFRDGKNKAKIGGKNMSLSGPAEIQDGNLLVPVRDVAPIVSFFTGQQVEYREGSRRVIVGEPIDFSAEVHGNPSRLVLHFSRAVNPKIASEAGHLRLSFANEPVVATESTETFVDKLISSAVYSERSGTSVLTITGTAPLMASYSDEGKTITIGAAPQAAVEKAPPPAPLTPAPQAAAPPATTAQGAAPAAPPKPRYLVVIDPAHGGDDRGAMLDTGVNEKDVTLAVARRLRAALDKEGIAAILLRDGDTTMTSDQRAMAANAARPAVYIAVHVGSVGRGVRVYTARMSSGAPASTTMVSWDAAQSGYLDRSRAVADSIAEQLAHASIDHAEDAAQLQPLPHLTSPAVVIELLPGKEGVSSLQSAEYQQRVCAAVAEGVAAGHRTLEAQK